MCVDVVSAPVYVADAHGGCVRVGYRR
jgi:hypothetical protein